jgi:hypothetical protein
MAVNTRGVFGVEKIRLKLLFDEWVNLDDVWISPSPNVPTPNTGYFGGGTVPGIVSRMDKVTYATDTTAFTPGANLSAVRNQLAATGNSTDGYFGGGAPGPGPVSTMDKVTYATDTTAATPGAVLSLARNSLGATGNSTDGYFGGGAAGGPGTFTTMDKLTYSSDTTAAVPGANLSLARVYPTATGSSTAGYFGGGGVVASPFTSYSRVDKLTYSTDTTAATPSANLSAARYAVGATGNSTAGYFGGGVFPGVVSRMDKLTYSTDTTAFTPGANLSGNVGFLAATGNSTAGYFGGGSAPGILSRMDKVTYATDTRAFTPSANLSIARFRLAASSARANALPALFPAPSAPAVRFSDGTPGTPPAATPTPATTTITVSDAGYFGGGDSALSTMDKITYATDTTAFTPSANLSSGRRSLAATGNSTAGYFGGGADAFGPISVSRMDKVTYATDTTAFTPGANLSASRYRLAATGNSTNGYFGGGRPGSPSTASVSTMDKVTYSTDTRAFTPGANLSVARHGVAATGNSDAGYFGGGDTASPSPAVRRSTMDKLTYATDTTVFTPGANLSAARYILAATGNSTAGYFGGGFDGLTSRMDKVTYATDTTAFTPGANLSASRFELAATGSSTAGYFGGGATPGPSSVSTMDKVTYATDTTAATPGANLSVARRGAGASSARANALPQPTATLSNIV